MNLKEFDHIDDKQLLEHFYLDRNNQWLGILLQRYTLLIYGVCMKYLKNEEESKDAVQQVFMKVISELGKYKVDYFKSWLYMITKNHCLMKLRDKTGRSMVEISERLQVTEESINIPEHIEKDKLLALMEDCMKELNQEQRRCLELFYLEKRTYAEVADTTGYTLLQVKSFIQNGKRNLKIMISKRLNIE